MYKVVLWGLGDGYNNFVSHHGLDMVEVVAIADKEDWCYKSVDGVPVIKPEEIGGGIGSFDFLIITMFNDNVIKQVIEEAVSMGIPREIILPLRIFWIPFFDFNEYVEIKKSNISIISDYCFAGYLYHKFGMKFTSPTINMFADNDNYYRFISDIEGHMKLPMMKVDDIVDEPYKGMFAYPRGRVGDSEWEFNHDESFETAADRWKRGVERFNPSNYIVTMTIRSDEMAYKFDELPIKYKMGFYWKDLGLESVICMPEWNSPKCRARFGYDFAGLTNRAADETMGIRAINWMRALLHKDGYNRIH